MNFNDLRSFIDHLEQTGQLVRVKAEVDPVQEITIIQHRVLAENGPALLFENVKGSPYRLVSNLFGTPERVTAAFGRPPAEIGGAIGELADQLMPPTLSAVWGARKMLWPMMRPPMRQVNSGPVLETCQCPPQLEQLPCLTCWPLDGGPFFTLPLVHTVDPVTGRGNLGIYRLQRYDDASAGMHWQIEKGGGFHFKQACRLGQSLPISVFLGGPPALTLAAIAPLPEGIDERMLLAVMRGCPLDVIHREETGHRIPAAAEFVIEGSVTDGDMQREGPFGDHLGHYSHSADFPVFRVDRVLARRDAIYPATVVGKPPQEDYFIGEALTELTLPILRIIKPSLSNLWAYPETGFHPLAVASTRQRYGYEALKLAMSILGEGQLSLTKVLIMVDDDVDVRDFEAVSRALWQRFDPAHGLHLLAPTAQDTLDFTGPTMNVGSRLILLAMTNGKTRSLAEAPEAPPRPESVHSGITGLQALGPAILMVQVADGADTVAIREALTAHAVTQRYLFHVFVSRDVDLNSRMEMLWGWFTRFDPLRDLHPARREPIGNRLVLHAPLTIDATWKEGYRKPVAFDPDHEKAVDDKWDSYGIRGA